MLFSPAEKDFLACKASSSVKGGRMGLEMLCRMPTWYVSSMSSSSYAGDDSVMTTASKPPALSPPTRTAFGVSSQAVSFPSDLVPAKRAVESCPASRTGLSVNLQMQSPEVSSLILINIGAVSDSCKQLGLTACHAQQSLFMKHIDLSWACSCHRWLIRRRPTMGHKLPAPADATITVEQALELTKWW